MVLLSTYVTDFAGTPPIVTEIGFVIITTFPEIPPNTAGPPLPAFSL